MKYFLPASPAAQDFGEYKKFGQRVFRECKTLAKGLRGLQVFHINSTAAGGGVAELLKSQIPLEKNLGLNSRWLALQEPKKFFFITKQIHNLLQGQKGLLSEPEKKYYLDQLAKPGRELRRLLDKIPGKPVVVLHDPQVLPLMEYLPPAAGIAVRLHIDLSTANLSALKFLRPFLEKADKVIISHELFRPDWLDRKKTAVSYPAINPFAPKNRELSLRRTAKYFKLFNIDLSRPLIAQISRFDPWKDPEGVIQSYYLAKKEIPKLQLVLEGAMEAKDDPQAQGIYQQLKMEYQNDPDLHLHGEKTLAGPAYQTWVNALQSRSGVIIQKSLREGFGLTVAEAMWKGKAVIGGDALGIKAQIKNGRSGYIVSSPAECAKRIVQLEKNPQLAKKLGQAGRLTVKNNFLFNRLILDFLKIYNELA
ncbi:MAG: glycosyltransferase [Patescibacteria group bacterium]|nr:glycosyltransferase [Patescibacteria group bacterium]